MNIDYYIPKQDFISFHQVGVNYANALRLMGWNVQIKYIEEGVSLESDVALVHPLFFLAGNPSLQESFVQKLGQYKLWFALEVADTTKISKRFVDWVNHSSCKAILLPSQFSIKAYKESGVTKPLELLPHGCKVYKPSRVFDFLSQYKQPKVLSFVVHESHRKGFDVILNMLSEFPDCLFVIKGPTLKEKPLYEQSENVVVINHWLSDEDLASLYLNCEVLFSPYRGGAFEMNCLEAACYGLPVVASGFGPVLDYLPKECSVFIPVRNQQVLWPEGSDHCGLGAVLDLQDVNNSLRLMINEYAERKHLALNNRSYLRTYYDWNQVTHIVSDSIKRYLPHE